LIVIVVIYLFPASVSQAILSVSRTSIVEITILMVFGILILVISGVLFPAALFSFTFLLDDFQKGKVGIGKKYAELAYFLAISGNSGVQKGGWLLRPLRRGIPEFSYRKIGDSPPTTSQNASTGFLAGNKSLFFGSDGTFECSEGIIKS
jgi:hypothetical protein